MNIPVQMSYDKICDKLEELEVMVSKLLENQNNTKSISKNKKSLKNGK